jgi:hypothetical protein
MVNTSFGKDDDKKANAGLALKRTLQLKKEECVGI